MSAGERLREQASGLVLPALFVAAWVLALTGSIPPGGSDSEGLSVSTIRWILYMITWAFLTSAVMHSVFAKRMAAMIGWQTNGFQYEIAFVSLGLRLGCLYASQHGPEAWIAVALPVISFLFLAGVNHVVGMVRERNFAPGNSLICVYDFGVAISLAVLLFTSKAI